VVAAAAAIRANFDIEGNSYSLCNALIILDEKLKIA
jgi:hypothetical protein